MQMLCCWIIYSTGTLAAGSPYISSTLSALKSEDIGLRNQTASGNFFFPKPGWIFLQPLLWLLQTSGLFHKSFARENSTGNSSKLQLVLCSTNASGISDDFCGKVCHQLASLHNFFKLAEQRISTTLDKELRQTMTIPYMPVSYKKKFLIFFSSRWLHCPDSPS